MSAVVPVEEPRQEVVAANPLDVSPEMFKGALQRRGDNRKALMEWIRNSLVRGTDYGRIHVVAKSKCDKGNRCTNDFHFSKDCLFKPGAEKIAGMLGVTPTFPTLHKYEDAALAGVELKQIILRCHMVDSSGRIVADGIGARSLDQDYGDINKALKMCSKSAHIDATLRMAGLSEVFTQDLDQMQADGKLDPVEPQGHPPDVCTPEKRNDYLPRVAKAIDAKDSAILKRLVGEMNEGVQRGVWSFLSMKQKAAARELLQKTVAPTPAQTYVERLREALDLGIDERIAELHRECNEDMKLALEISALMTPAEMNRINEAADRMRG